MIICLNFIKITFGKSNKQRLGSLVECDNCKGKRVIRKDNADIGKGIKYCNSCAKKGKNHPLFGKHISKEIREKMRLAHLGKKLGEEHKQKISLGQIGKIVSQETRKKMSLAQNGHPTTKETREKIGAGNKGEKSGMFGKRRDKHPRWNDALTIEERENSQNRMYNPQMHEWRELIFKRDNHTCKITGIKGGSLVVHHLNGWNKFPKQRFDINNGITISQAYHKLFHKIYGKGNNTKAQFEEFKQNILN